MVRALADLSVALQESFNEIRETVQEEKVLQAVEQAKIDVPAQDAADAAWLAHLGLYPGAVGGRLEFMAGRISVTAEYEVGRAKFASDAADCIHGTLSGVKLAAIDPCLQAQLDKVHTLWLAAAGARDAFHALSNYGSSYPVQGAKILLDNWFKS